MLIRSPEARRALAPVFAVILALGSWLSMPGCGPTEEAFEDEEWDTSAQAPPPAEAPAISPAPLPPPAEPAATVASPGAALAMRVDSLTKANLMLQGQVDALTAENRTLRTRVGELEARARSAQAPAAIMTPAPSAPPRAPVNPSSDLKAAYSDALDQFMNRNYQEAIAQFEGILQANPKMELADNCTYWIGESYYALKNYTEAMRHFERVLDYPSSGKKPYAQYMIGNSQLALGNRAAARDAFTAVVSAYGGNALVPKAQAKLARLN
jgi:tol-pal system protein YbgF